MKSSRIHNTIKTTFKGKKPNTTKTRFLILASFLLITISSTVALSSTSAASSITEFIFGGTSAGTTQNKPASDDNKSKKDAKTSKVLKLAPDAAVSEAETPRVGHTATKLNDDNVLIIGGDGAAGTAEIFDTKTGNSSAAGNLTAARSGHTATKLDDKRVLIAGGASSGAALASTEIFDSSTGKFDAGATMNQARTGHTATVLANGNILIAGGDGIGSADIYDAAAGTFTAIATMTASRIDHSAALMKDGRVLIVGGKDASGAELNSAEIFDPATSSFSATGNQMKHHRTQAVLRVLHDGKVQIIGGNNDTSMEVYDPAIDTIGAYAHVIPTNDEHDALLQSDILSAPTRAAMFHNGQNDALLDRSNFTVTELGDKALVSGGVDSNGNVLSSSTLLNSSNATVTTEKLDYQPGQTAVISGTGWQAGETVNIIIHEDPHTHTERRLTATANAEGNFTTNYSVEWHDANVAFIIGAKGQASNRTAQTTFTDTVQALSITSPTSASPVTISNLSNPVTISFTYRTTASQTTTRVANIKSGASVIATSGSQTITSGGQTPNPALTGTVNITLPAGTLNGTYDVELTVTNGTGASGTVTRTQTGAVIVNVSNNTAPVASNVTISGTAKFGEQLTGNYTYSDANNDLQGTSTFRWLRNGTAIGGATSTTYTTVAADVGATLTFEVTPVAQTGVLIGTAATSSGALIGKADSTTTITCPASVAYNGLAQTPCTVSVTGAGGLNLTPTPTYSNNTNAGTATASYTFVATATHLTSNDSKNFTISKAVTTTVVTCPTSVTFTGAALTPCSATVTGAGGLNETLTVGYGANTNVGTASASASYAETANYQGSSDSKNFTINKAPTTTTLTCPTNAAYTGATVEPCTATVTGAGGLNQSVAVVYTNNTNAGTASASATYAESANHLTSSGSKSFTIDKATTTTVVTCPTSVTYTGSAQTPCTAAVTGPGLNQSFTVEHTNNINAGTATASANYTESGNYLGSTDSKNFTIAKAVTATVLTCPASATYTGAASEPCSATVMGAGNLSESVTVAYGNNVNAGTASATATYAETANYLGSSDSKNFTINKAATTTTVTCPVTVTYTGSAIESCTAVVTGANLNQLLTVGYSNNVNAGTATASASYTESANYLGSSDSKNFTIDKANSITTINCPASVTYTGAAQTPCTATVTGAGLNLTPTPGYANNTNAGTATASYTFAGDGNHNGSNDTKNFTIEKAVTTTVLTCSASATYTGAAIEPCSATVTGANLNQSAPIVYTNNTNAGTASATATYAENANYLGSSDSKNFTISKATTTTVVTCSASVTFTGAAQTPCTATVTGANLNQSLTVGYSNNTNAGTAGATATYEETANYLGSTDSKNFTIAKAVTATVLTCPASATYTGAAIEPCSAIVMGAGGLNQTVTAVYTDNTNAGTASASATFAETANYLGSSDSKNFTISKATTTTKITCPANVTYTGSAIEPCTAAVTGANLNESVTVSYSNNTNNGTATANASYTESANYLGSSDSKNFTIDKAATTTVVTCPANVTFTGAALTPCTAKVTGAGLNESLMVNHTNNTNAGTGSASATYTESTNYLGSTDSKNFTIDKATSTTTVSGGGSYVFDSLPHAASVSVTGAGGLNLNPAPVYSGNCSAAPVFVAQTPCTASYTYAGDANHLGSNGSTIINITAFGAMTSVTVSQPSQYSDKVSFTATVTPGFAGVVPAASTVTFFVGTQNMGTANLSTGTGGTLTATLADVALLEGVAGQMSPGGKTVTATFGSVNPNFTVNNATTQLTITQENATATYSGSQYFATASPTSTKAQVTLSATVVDDADGAHGDIRNAIVEFRKGSQSGELLGTSSRVGLVNPLDSKVGTATTSFEYTITGSEANAGGTTFDVYAVVKGYYTGVSDVATISVVIPGTESVNGGGFLTMQSSSGQFAGLTGSKMNFGYTMKYNKSGKNLQGQANIIIRGANGKVYQIKSNAVDSLAVIGTTFPKGASFTTKANMTDISNPLAPIALGGNLKLQVDMTDAGSGGQTDKIGITLFNSDGGLYFTSNWNVTKTIEQLLGGGNISVR